MSIKIIWSDNDLEFHIPDFYNQRGIVHKTTCVETSQRNGIVEWKHKHLLNIARALKFQSHLSLAYWDYFITHAAYLINKTPTSLLSHKTPFELLFNSPPPYQNLRIFGCLAHATSLECNSSKFDPRARAVVFIGFLDNTKGYTLLDLCTREFFNLSTYDFF